MELENFKAWFDFSNEQLKGYKSDYLRVSFLEGNEHVKPLGLILITKREDKLSRSDEEPYFHTLDFMINIAQAGKEFFNNEKRIKSLAGLLYKTSFVKAREHPNYNSFAHSLKLKGIDESQSRIAACYRIYYKHLNELIKENEPDEIKEIIIKIIRYAMHNNRQIMFDNFPLCFPDNKGLFYEDEDKGFTAIPIKKVYKETKLTDFGKKR